MLIDFGGISLLIELQNLFVLIISKTYQVDRIWSYISVDKYPRHIRVDKYPKHIKLIEFGVLSALINIQNISS